MHNCPLLLQIADQYLLNGLCYSHSGLWNGKTGMSVFFFLLSRATGNKRYEDFAGELLDDVCSNLSSRTPVSFADGLCGIGWAIEYLNAEGFIEADTNDILSEVDRQIMERDVRRITDYTLETGLEGIVSYIQIRMDNNSNVPTFDRTYLKEIEDACKRAGLDWTPENYGLSAIWSRMMLHFSKTSNYELLDWQAGLCLLNAPIESGLYHSTRKCLFIFSIDNIAANYGVGTYIRQLIKCFDQNEWDVNVVTLEKAFIDRPTFRQEEGIGWYGIPASSGLRSSYYKGIFHFLTSRLRIGQEVYCHFNFVSQHELAKLFKEQLKATVIFTLHFTSWNILLQGDKKELKRLLMQPSNKVKITFEKEKSFMMECCDKVIAIAGHAYETLHQLYGIPYHKLVCISNGVQDDYKERTEMERQSIRQKYGFGTNERIILYAGRLELGKGIVELVKAFKNIRKTLPNVRLVIAGNGNFNNALEEANPEWNHIIYTGFIPKKLLYELYAIAEVGVVPSFHEEFGYVAAEMMLHKLPVIINNTMGLKEITENGKYAIPFHYGKDRDFTPLEEALIHTLSGRIDKKMLEEGRNRIIKNYSMQMFRRKIRQLYDNVSK